MRSDLTSQFQTQMAAIGRKPRMLAEFHFSVAGTVYVSDQALGAADGLSHAYRALVEEWGVMSDTAGGDVEAIATSEIRQMTITLWNGGTAPFSDYFLKEDPENVLVDIYQWFDGMSESSKALIDTFIVQDPIRFTEASRLLTLDLVSINLLYDRPLNDMLSIEDWPNAKIADVGKGIDLIIGTVDVATICARTAPEATLNGSILATAMTIAVNEDLDDLGFSASGIIQIGEEKIRYSSRTSSAFTVSQRGWTTTAAEHLDRDEIVQLVTDHTYLVGKGPVSSISNIKVGGFAAPAGIYTAYPSTDPAKIVFSEKPYLYQFAKGSAFLEMQFDSVNAENTAIQPGKAFDAANLASAAMINESYAMLSLRQATVNPDRGAIVKAYLAVEHWESGVFTNDYAEVWISGVGVVGRLSQPHADDSPDLTAEVDIDHGHVHQIGGDHAHAFQDPSIATQDAAHTHGTENVSQTVVHYPSEPAGFTLYAYQAGQYGGVKTLRFTGLKNFNIATIYVKVYLAGAGCVMFPPGNVWGVELPSGETRLGFGAYASGDDFFITFKAKGWGVVNGNIVVASVNVEATTDAEITDSFTGVATSVIAAGDVQQNLAAVKAPDDVANLATDNVALQVTDLQAPTKSNVNLFDITAHVAFDWGWFTNRDLRVTYTGTHDDKNVYILHAFFDIEYRKRERVFSDEITASVTGIVDDGSGTYTGTPDAVITRPDRVYKYLQVGCGDIPAGYIDGATFAAAGTRFAALGYTVDGIFQANMTVREAVKKLEFQTRSRMFWNAGKAKLAVREKQTDWGAADKALTTTNLQLKSLSAVRQKSADLVNTIKLLYDKDHTIKSEDRTAYRQNVNDSDAASVASHGVKEDRSRFLFDLVTDDDMAESLIDFYIDTQKNPSTFYSFNAYLEQFDIEKEDIITITSDFNKLRKALMVVRAANRMFGSGKLRRMNMINIVAECLRYILIEIAESDTVYIAESLMVEIGLEGFFADLVHIADSLTAAYAKNNSESVTLSEVLSVIAAYNPDLGETATVTETLAAALNLALSDSVRIIESVKAWAPNFGFGAGQFGIIGFGGWSLYGVLSVLMAEVSDDLTITDGIGIAETATVSETLYFVAGFGGDTLSDGFGEVPFGL